jgi:hypothetical protein
MNTPRHHHKRGFLAAASVAIPALLIGFGPPAQAAYIVTLEEVGTNVVATGSGTLDLADLRFLESTVGETGMLPNLGLIITGPANSLIPVDLYSGITGPNNFGSGGPADNNTGSGGLVGIEGASPELDVPMGYHSGNPLMSGATWDNTNFSTLQVTPGTYVWTWGSGADADSFTLQIGAVPAPLIGRGLPVLLVVVGLLFGAKLFERTERRKVA